MKPLLLIIVPMSDAHRAQIAACYDILYAPKADSRDTQIAAAHNDVRIVLTNGTVGLAAEAIDLMPRLEMICALGVGYENIPLDHARNRGIVLANGSGTNSDCVADHAMALLLSTVRRVMWFDAQLRQGAWRNSLPMPASVSGRRMGIIGLGDIGKKIARRAAAFDIEVGYFNRRQRDDVAYAYHPGVLDLARWSDFLVIATPGGADTFHLVDAGVLDALGPRGVLVNIARGSIVDTAALAAALLEGRIAGAGLDVYEGEPNPPECLFGIPGVVLTPHVAGWSAEAAQNSVNRFLENVAGHFSGTGAVSPI